MKSPLCRVIGCLIVSMLLVAGSASVAAGRGWMRSGRVDPGTPVGLACPSSSLCVAVDQDGNIVSSLFPAGIHAYINNVANAAAAGRAAAGAQCWWNTGPQDSGWINPNGYQTADVAVPWVMCGLRESGGGMIYLRATNLRNQQ